MLKRPGSGLATRWDFLRDEGSSLDLGGGGWWAWKFLAKKPQRKDNTSHGEATLHNYPLKVDKHVFLFDRFERHPSPWIARICFSDSKRVYQYKMPKPMWNMQQTANIVFFKFCNISGLWFRTFFLHVHPYLGDRLKPPITGAPLGSMVPVNVPWSLQGWARNEFKKMEWKPLQVGWKNPSYSIDKAIYVRVTV